MGPGTSPPPPLPYLSPLARTPSLPTRIALFVSIGDNKAVEHREYLPPIWQRAVTHRVLLQRHQRPRISQTPQTHGSRSDLVSVGAGDVTGPAFSLFTARVTSLKTTTAEGEVHRGSGGRGGGRGGGGRVGGKEYFFIVTDNGIHDVPAAAASGGTVGRVAGWRNFHTSRVEGGLSNYG